MNAYTVKDIADYIIRAYPDSCLSRNIHLKEASIAECIKFFYYEKLHWCGCGNPGAALEVVQKYLDVVREQHDKSWNAGCALLEKAFGVESIFDNALLLCLAYSLDAAELTEHGGGIGGEWLTENDPDFAERAKAATP